MAKIALGARSIHGCWRISILRKARFFQVSTTWAGSGLWKIGTLRLARRRFSRRHFCREKHGLKPSTPAGAGTAPADQNGLNRSMAFRTGRCTNDLYCFLRQQPAGAAGAGGRQLRLPAMRQGAVGSAANQERWSTARRRYCRRRPGRCRGRAVPGRRYDGWQSRRAKRGTARCRGSQTGRACCCLGANSRAGGRCNAGRAIGGECIAGASRVARHGANIGRSARRRAGVRARTGCASHGRAGAGAGAGRDGASRANGAIACGTVRRFAGRCHEHRHAAAGSPGHAGAGPCGANAAAFDGAAAVAEA